MFRLLSSICVCLLCIACAPDTDSAVAETTPVTPPPPKARPAKQAAPAAVDGQTVPTVTDVFLLTALSTEATPGEEVCVPVRTDGFAGILGIQYTLRWEADKLKYKRLMVGQHPQFTARNVNERQADKGLLPIVWIDEALRGVTLPDGAILYQVCFDAIGAAGQTATVGFTNQPTPYEAVNAAEQVLTFRGQDGQVTIR